MNWFDSSRAVFAAICLVSSNAALGQEANGAAVFSQSCVSCHGGQSSIQAAPRLDALRLQQATSVFDTLTSGVMRAQAQRLNPSEIRAVAEYVTGKKLSAEIIDPGKGRCAAQKPMMQMTSAPPLGKLGAQPVEHQVPGKRHGGYDGRRGPET